jgi:DNA-binding response OmpR family regulator
MAKTKVLIIEDSKNLSTALKGVLELEGLDVVVAGDGVAGVVAAKKELPGLILLDLMLPKLSGFEVCKKLKTDNTTWKIPVVVMSTLTSPDQVDRAKEAGANHFIGKPYDLDVIVNEIKKFLPK